MEYQVYEFQALDKRLTKSEQDYIQTLSSRVQLTPNTAVFTYSYSDLPGNSKDLLIKCFDIMLYIANWGNRQLMFRLPLSLVDLSELEQYYLPDVISIEIASQYVIINIDINEEEGLGWIEEGGYLSPLVGLRDDLLNGDYRVLYLAWLKAAPILLEMEEIAEDELEPPVPANLQNLSSNLQAFVDFLEIDADLITVAAQNSSSSKVKEQALVELIPSLPETEKNDFLTRLLTGEPLLEVQLTKRLKELSQTSTTTNNSDDHRRSLSELLESVQKQREIREKQEQAAAAQARINRLKALAPKQTQMWEEVFKLITMKQAKPYDQAVAHLMDLRDLAEFEGKLQEFRNRINQIERDYSRLSGLMSRMKKAKLI